MSPHSRKCANELSLFVHRKGRWEKSSTGSGRTLTWLDREQQDYILPIGFSFDFTSFILWITAFSFLRIYQLLNCVNSYSFRRTLLWPLLKWVNSLITSPDILYWIYWVLSGSWTRALAKTDTTALKRPKSKDHPWFPSSYWTKEVSPHVSILLILPFFRIWSAFLKNL